MATLNQRDTEPEKPRTRKRNADHASKRAKIAQACEECRARKGLFSLVQGSAIQVADATVMLYLK